MANADTLKAAAAVVKHPAVQAVLAAFPEAEITAVVDEGVTSGTTSSSPSRLDFASNIFDRLNSPTN